MAVFSIDAAEVATAAAALVPAGYAGDDAHLAKAVIAAAIIVATAIEEHGET